MNAIVSLCHFCEGYGPSILFCTQTYPPCGPNIGNHPYADGLMHAVVPDTCAEQRLYLPAASTGATSVDRTSEGAGAPQVEVPSYMAKEENRSESIPTSPTLSNGHEACETCRSFPPGQRGCISTDDETGVRYVSTQHPSHPQVYTTVRQACVRSLSCEQCPGREGPIFFGDEDSGHVLSHTFVLKDSQGRGFQRRFSIIIVMMDKIFLLNSWPFLVKHLRALIDEIQQKAEAVYKSEQGSCPHRSRLKTSSMMTSLNFRQHRGTSKPVRSLAELTNDKHIFRKLHQAFTWLLKAGGNRLSEKLLEGPPTEDSIVDIEKQEETEEGFVNVVSRRVGAADDMDLQPGADDGMSDDGDTASQHAPGPEFRNLRQLLKVLGYTSFHTVAYHVVIGNQVVVRGSQPRLVASIIACLKALLPRGCCRSTNYSRKYQDSWRCNFLGLAPHVELPPHAELYVTVTVGETPAAPREGAEEGWAAPRPEASLAASEGPTRHDMSRYTFTVESHATLPDKSPSVLTKMEFALLNDNLADSVVDQCLICLKEEWMNKVKVLFKFTKAGGNRSEEDTRKLLQVVGAQSQDKIVLQFWLTGLSVQHRNHMLSSAINQSLGAS